MIAKINQTPLSSPLVLEVLQQGLQTLVEQVRRAYPLEVAYHEEGNSEISY